MSTCDQTSIVANEVSAPNRTNTLDDAQARIPRNLCANWASYAVNILVTFLAAPLLVHHLGNMAYGVWALIGQTVEYSFLLDFGARIAATRYVARHMALVEPEEVNRVVTSGLFLCSLSVVPALVCGGAVAWALPRFFTIPSGLVADARWTVLLCSAGIAVSFPGSIFSACVAAASRYDLLGIRRSAPAVVRLLVLWILLAQGAGLLTVAIVSALAVSAGYGLDFLFALRLFPQLRVRRKFLDRSMLKTLLSFSFYAFVISVSMRVLFMTDNIVVGFVLGPTAVTFYTVGMSLASTLRDTLGNITTIYTPLAYQMDALDRKDALRRLFVAGSRIALLYVLPGVLGLAILGPRFLGFWMGESFVRQSGPILVLLSVEVGFCSLTAAPAQVLYAMKRHTVNAWLALCLAAANFTLSVTLIRWLGAAGVAWGTAIPAFPVEAIILPLYTASLLQVSPLSFYRSVVLRPLLIAAPYGLWLWFCLARGLIRGYESLALMVGAGLVLYALLAWQFGLESEERAFARRWLVGLRSAVMRVSPVRSSA
jgi:O-antigen/teichoic acid export membrane protein